MARKQKPLKAPIRVWMDDREDNAFLREGKNVFPKAMITRLGIGDVIVERNGKFICFEHKRGDDFSASIKDKRLELQPLNMVQKFDYNFVMIEGTYRDIIQEYDLGNFTEKQYNGKIASLALKYVTPPITVDGTHQFWRMIHSFGERLAVVGEPLVKPIVLPNKQDTLETRMLMCIDGMGPERATLILKEFDFWDLPEVSAEELTTIKGIGDVYAEKIRNSCRR